MPWIDEMMPETMKKLVYVKHLDGPLFFGSASGFQSLINKIPDMKYVILRMEKVPFIDQSGLICIGRLYFALEQKGIEVLLTGVQKQPLSRMKSINIIPSLDYKAKMFLKDLMTA